MSDPNDEYLWEYFGWSVDGEARKWISDFRCDNLIIMESHISATEAARRFSDILNRVAYRREEFVIERGGEPVCRIVPAGSPPCNLADLAKLLSTIPKPDPAFWDEVEALTKNQSDVPESSW